MRDADNWLSLNDQYLCEALAWLRTRLEQLAPKRARRQRCILLRWLGDGKRAAAAPRTLPAAPQWNAAQPPALMVLAERLGLTDFERDLMLLCAAMELDTRIGPLCARAQGDPARPFPTFALAFALFDHPEWDAAAPSSPLRHWHVVEVQHAGVQPLNECALRADERIVNFIKGLNLIDERVRVLLAPMAKGTLPLPPSQARMVANIEAELAWRADVGGLPAVQLMGADSASKRLVALAVAAARGAELYLLHGETLPSAAAEVDLLARLWQRETLLMPLGLMVDGSDLERSDRVRRLLQGVSGLVFLDAREAWPGVARGMLRIEIAKPLPVEQRAAWSQALGAAGGQQPARLAGQFDLSMAAIADIARAALAQAQPQPAPDSLAKALWGGCLMHARPALDQLAQRVTPKATWDDLQLPPQEEEQLRKIAAQVGQRGTVYDDFGFRARMNRGLGISVLFAGDSGTGKTMAAEVIASELGMLLYRIDLSAVVSKYIGETEKNLRKLFDAAENGGAILFFDEADALFGKRSEVRDSHDRYANIEVNYLLQRIEAFQGLAILATNMKGALDGAFTRRLRFIINFPFPGQVQRKAMWQRVFPAPMPRAALDFERLARLNLSGGNIQSIALNGAFAAASTGAGVNMALLLDAARAEFRKMDKPIIEADFRLRGAGEAAP